jgi:hypothetical protein
LQLCGRVRALFACIDDSVAELFRLQAIEQQLADEYAIAKADRTLIEVSGDPSVRRDNSAVSRATAASSSVDRSQKE